MDPYDLNQQQINAVNDLVGEVDNDYQNFVSPIPEMDSFFAEVMKTEEKIQESRDSGYGGGLARQRSSPAGFLSNLMMENDFPRDFSNSNSVNGEASWSKMKSEHMLPLSRLGTITPQASSNIFEGNNITFSDLETQNAGCSRKKLTSHLSLPTTFSERNRVDKFLHFQEKTVPFKVRARRGFATHPRSIAERMRRNGISQRMKKLQDLFPDMDKQSSTADMLDLAVSEIKELQREVKDLKSIRRKCSCYGKGDQKQEL